MVYPDPKFLTFKTKEMASFFFLRLEVDFSLMLCDHARNFQENITRYNEYDIESLKT